MSVVPKLEKEIEKAVVSRARKAGWHVWKIGSPGSHGLPDRMFVHPVQQRLVFIEFKRPGGKPSPMQIVVAEILRRAGIKVEFVYDVQTGLEILGLEP